MKLKVKKLNSLREKSIGLIGANPITPVFFTTRWGIHTFGVLFPIDVVILDNNFRVVQTKTVPPNCIFLWNPMHQGVLELPEGTILKRAIITGSYIEVEEISCNP